MFMAKRVHSPMADSFVKTDLFIIKCYVPNNKYGMWEIKANGIER